MKHWTDNDFTRWLYGLKDEDPHLEECPECRGEITRLAQKRREMLAQAEVPADFLAAQRRKIYGRLGGRAMPRFAPMRWTLPAIMLVVMVVSISVFRSNRATAPLYTPADEKLFSELASMEQSSEPRAIKPIHNLFEE